MGTDLDNARDWFADLESGTRLIAQAVLKMPIKVAEELERPENRKLCDRLYEFEASAAKMLKGAREILGRMESRWQEGWKP